MRTLGEDNASHILSIPDVGQISVTGGVCDQIGHRPCPETARNL